MCKVSKYNIYSGLYFPIFALNMEIYRVLNLRILYKGQKRVWSNVFLACKYIQKIYSIQYFLYIEIKRKRKKLLSRGSAYHCSIFNSWFLKTQLRSETIFGNWKSFKYDGKYFYFTLKAHFILKLLKFSAWLFG